MSEPCRQTKATLDNGYLACKQHLLPATRQARRQEAWQTVAWRDGTKKTLCKQFTDTELYVCGLPRPSSHGQSGASRRCGAAATSSTVTWLWSC